MKRDFNCSNSFTLSGVDQITTETKSFESVVGNVVTWFVTQVANITQCAIQFRSRLISQLIKTLKNSPKIT